MATMILVEREGVKAIADIYRTRQMRLAELAAKKELVSMATAIDAATAKGNYELSYRLSGSITKLKGDYYAAAMAIIIADIEAAGYVYTKDDKGFTFGWENAPVPAEDEPEVPGGNDPVDPGEGGEEPGEGGEGSGEGGTEGGEGSNEGNEGEGGEGSDPTEPVQPEEPTEPEQPEEPAEPVYTYRRLEPEDFVNGLDVLPDGMAMEDIFYKVYPWDDTVEMLPMHELPFDDDNAYFLRTPVEE